MSSKKTEQSRSIESFPDILILSEAAALLRVSTSYAYKNYSQWQGYGVRILRVNPVARPRFYKKDLLSMLERRK